MFISLNPIYNVKGVHFQECYNMSYTSDSDDGVHFWECRIWVYAKNGVVSKGVHFPEKAG